MGPLKFYLGFNFFSHSLSLNGSRSSEYPPLSDIIDLIMTGDCDTDDDCEGSLMCGKNNCKGDFFSANDDCCTDIPPPCSSEQKTEYLGWQYDVANPKAYSQQECADACLATGGNYWTWVPESNWCYIKSKIDGKGNHSTAVSGDKWCGSKAPCHEVGGCCKPDWPCSLGEGGRF